jgi:hypothetical protein
MTLLATESFYTVAEITTYWAGRNDNDVWANAELAAQEAAAREASQYISYYFNFIGQHTGDVDTQPLAWPRNYVVVSRGSFSGVEHTDGTTPNEIGWATAELALLALDGPLDPPLERGGNVKFEKIGDLETEYFPGASPKKTYDYVGMLLNPFLVNGSGVASVYRA